MVDNIIDGVYANVTRINPETLSPYARSFMKSFREDIKQYLAIDKNLGNLLVKTILKYHNDTGESLMPLITELSTVSFFVIEKYRKYYLKVVEYILLGIIFGILTVTDDEQEIGDLIQQSILAVLTNPIFEFSAEERLSITKTAVGIIGYIKMLNFFTHRFTDYLPLIKSAVSEGLVQALEICGAGQDEINAVKDDQYALLNEAWGKTKFFINVAWPMFNINIHSLIRWLNKKSGIEFWPEKER